MSIPHKPFYFVRHGQTDWNVLRSPEGYGDLPLNETGVKQANAISLVVRDLPIASVCSSPLLRVQQTKHLILQHCNQDELLDEIIHELRECSDLTWDDFDQRDEGIPVEHRLIPDDPNFENAETFIERIRQGLHKALALPGPVLIVAHGGTHRAISELIGMPDHIKRISNCIPVHFDIHEGRWNPQRLVESTGLFAPTAKELAYLSM